MERTSDDGPTERVGGAYSPALPRIAGGGRTPEFACSGSEGRIRALRRRRMVRDLEQFLAVHLVGFVREANSEAGHAFASN